MDIKTKEDISKENRKTLKLDPVLQDEWDKFLTLINFVKIENLMNSYKPNRTNTITNFGEIGKKLNNGEITIQQCEKILVEDFKESLTYKDDNGKFKRLTYPEYRKIIIENIIKEFKYGRLGDYYKHEDNQVAYKNPVICEYLLISRYMEESRRNNGLYDNRYYARDIRAEQICNLVNPSTILVDLDLERHKKVQNIMSTLNSETLNVSFYNVVLKPTAVPGLFTAISEQEESEFLELTNIKNKYLLPYINLIESSTKKANREQRDKASSLLVLRERNNKTSIIDKIRAQGIKETFEEKSNINSKIKEEIDDSLFY